MAQEIRWRVFARLKALCYPGFARGERAAMRRGAGMPTVLACAATLALSGCFLRLPDVAVLKTQYPVVHYHGPDAPSTVTIEKARPATWVPLAQVAKPAYGAIIVSEDWAFYQHKGLDTHQIKEALTKDWEKGGFARGASTITQQVAKNVFLDRDKTIVRKVKEAILALRLEQAIGKAKILEVYLNVAEWGEGIFGIGPAADFYFHKKPAELSAHEGAFLAMLLPSPKRYSQSFRAKRLTPYASKTVATILRKEVQARYLTEAERRAQAARALSFEEASAPAVPLEPEPAPDDYNAAEEGAFDKADEPDGGAAEIRDGYGAEAGFAPLPVRSAAPPPRGGSFESEDSP